MKDLLNIPEWKKYDHVLIFHHFDADGYCAAAVVGGMFLSIGDTDKSEYVTDVDYYSVSHNKPMNIEKKLEDLTGDKLIFILDYSFSRSDDQNELLELMKREDCNVVWIDHHATSKVIEETQEFGSLPGMRVLEEGSPYAGCILTWLWLSEFLTYEKKKAEMTDELKEYADSYDYIPWWIKYVSDYDTFTKDYKDSEYFVKAANTFGLQKVFLDVENVGSLMETECDDFYPFVWMMAFEKFQIYRGGGTDVDEALKESNALLSQLAPVFNILGRNKLFYNIVKYLSDKEEYQIAYLNRKGEEYTILDSIKNKRAIKNNAFESRISVSVDSNRIDPCNKFGFKADDKGVINREYRVLCINRIGNSLSFGEKFQEYDAVATMHFDGENFTYSMFSKEGGAECNLIAIIMNEIYKITGGGHLHAAGWTTPVPCFYKGKRTDVVINSEGNSFKIV